MIRTVLTIVAMAIGVSAVVAQDRSDRDPQGTDEEER